MAAEVVPPSAVIEAPGLVVPATDTLSGGASCTATAALKVGADASVKCLRISYASRRSPRRFARSRSSIRSTNAVISFGSCGATCENGVMPPVASTFTSWPKLSPSTGRLPERHSYRMTPSDQMSA